MQTIIPMSHVAANICGKQKIKSDERYRLTRHCISIPCKEGKLLFHTLTGSLVLLSPEFPETRRDLIENWYLVPEDFDENFFSDQTHKIADMFVKNKTSLETATILTTTDCNARCFYCYEDGCARSSMDTKTAYDVAEYIAKRASKSKELRINWFGGEPLYNIPPIEIITEYLHQHNVQFYSSMISNGFYLTPEIARKARSEWELRSVQITIDGTRQIYNKTKAYIDNYDDPFSRVLDNIEAALDEEIKVDIRLNVDQRNVEDILDVVDILGSRFGERKKCHINADLLRPYNGKIHDFVEEHDAAEAWSRITQKIKTYGLEHVEDLKTGLYSSHCMADNDGAELIMPDGRIGKCEHFQDDEMIGSIYSSKRDQKLIDAWKEIAHMPECADCPLYPRCINLEMCAWTKLGCSEAIRAIKGKSLRELILQAYDKWKDEQSEYKR